jgi:predicted nucleotidyltransferase
LFGSEARGEANRESDVDVAVLLDRSRVPRAEDRAERRVRLGADLIAAAGRNDIDVVMLNDVPPGLGRAVVLAGTRIFCADAELDHAFRRDVQLRAADLDPFLAKMRRLKLARILSGALSKPNPHRDFRCGFVVFLGGTLLTGNRPRNGLAY